MNLIEVKNYIEENFIGFLPEQYKDYTVSFNKTYKTNREVEGFTIKSPYPGDQVVPTMYVEDVLSAYERGEELDEILMDRANVFVEAIGREPKELVTSIMNIEHLKDNVVFSVVNAKENEEMLKNCPHRLFEDLAITYRWIIKNDPDGLYTNRVDNNACQKFGINEEFLFEHAKENTLRLMPVTIRNINEVISDIVIGKGVEMGDELKGEFDQMIAEIPNERTMFVVSNTLNMFGANSLLFPDKFAELASKFDSDMYIIPSSTHEVIAISSKSADPEELAKMVYDVNRDEVPIEDRLSNEVYFFDRDKREIYLATDVPNKSLSNMVAERNINYDAHRR